MSLRDDKKTVTINQIFFAKYFVQLYNMVHIDIKYDTYGSGEKMHTFMQSNIEENFDELD
jgi:hypothetical protein